MLYPGKFRVFFLLLVLTSLFTSGGVVNAQATENLQTKIADHQTEIKKLEAEIAKYNKDLKTATTATKSLKQEIARLEATRNKLAAEIHLTGEQIATAKLSVQQLTSVIVEDQVAIEHKTSGIQEVLRATHQQDEVTLVEALAGYQTLSDFWGETDTLLRLRTELENKLMELADHKTNLETRRREAEQKRVALADLEVTLASQKQIAEKNQSEKGELLTTAKNQETTYQALLNDRLAKKEAFEKELFDFESQLRLSVDHSRLPPAGRGVLNWPLDEIIITQKFGKTSASGRLYASGTHNGVDFGTPVGTPVKAVLTGLVLGAGDTDPVCPRASYGKWILLQHANGLSTAYGHLSNIRVKAGETVTTGQVIGYSGNTGYSTGPHLHLSVYASDGVQVVNRASSVCHGTYTMPVATPAAYLDPLVYL